jgi:hypothetical protein
MKRCYTGEGNWVENYVASVTYVKNPPKEQKMSHLRLYIPTYCVGPVCEDCRGVDQRAALQVQIHVSGQGHQVVPVLGANLSKSCTLTSVVNLDPGWHKMIRKKEKL